VLRWESVRVDASDCLSVADLSRKIGNALEAVLATDAHVPRAVRVTVSGKSPAHGLFFGRATQLRAEVLNQIGIIGNDKLWLEKVKLETTAADAAAAQNEQLEALVDLKQILEAATQDPDFLAMLERDLHPFIGKVRSEVKEDAPLLELAREARLAALVEQVAPALLARLSTGE
jgi:DNA repair protein SbcD/Mre11